MSFNTKKYGTIIHTSHASKKKVIKNEETEKIYGTKLYYYDKEKEPLNFPIIDNNSYVVIIVNPKTHEERSFIVKFDEKVHPLTLKFHIDEFLDKMKRDCVVTHIPYTYKYSNFGCDWIIKKTIPIGNCMGEFELWNQGYEKELKDAKNQFFEKHKKIPDDGIYYQDRYDVINELID